MKKASAIALAFFIFFIGEINGQVYFDLLHGDSISSQLTGRESCLKNDDGYFVVTQRITLNWHLHFFSIDHLGNPITEFSIPLEDTLSERARMFMQDGDSAVVCLAYLRNLNQNSSITGDFALTRVYLNGAMDWRRIYGQDNRIEAPDRFIKCLDGGYLIVGQSINGVTPNEDGDGIIMKVDAFGAFEFEKEFGGITYDALADVVQTPDSGFLLLGWTRSYGAGQRDFYLVKTDSVGNQEWQQTYGDGGNEGGQSIMQLSDGNYLLVGGSSPDGVSSHGRLYKIDPLGTVLWTENYSMQNGNSLFKTVELTDGSLVSTGLTTTSGESNAGWLIKTDGDGTLLWQRKYNKSSSVDLFYSILATDDGGFLLSGQAMNEETGSQDAWLLKVDSVGCPYPNCTVGIDEAEPTKVVVDVWPNPASEVVNVQLQQPGKAQITITDMAGRSYSPPYHAVQGVVGQFIQYDISTFESGLYLLTIIQNTSKSNVRFVVQR